jgi:hypothetical protein
MYCSRANFSPYLAEAAIRDAPDTVFAGYLAGRISGSTKAKYQISGRILGFTTIFLVKYLINL